MLPKISVIVPIYNVEKYLPRCIESIQNQTLREIEIILIDDGSTDKSGQIIDDYAQFDNRIIAIHKENGGQSSARNVGLEKASAQYVGFVDSDDWIDLSMYQSMYDRVFSTSSDICVCGRSQYSQDYKLEYDLCISEDILDFNINKRQDYVANSLFYKHTVSTCNKIYNLDIIKNYKITFKDVSNVGSEDALFNYSYLLHAGRICTLAKPYYNNVVRVGSTTRTYKHGYMHRSCNLIESMDSYAKANDAEELAKDIIPLFLLFFFQWNISQIKMYAENIYNDLKNELKTAQCNKVYMRYVYILCHSRMLSKYMKSMGYSNKGILLLKFEMLSLRLKLFTVLTKLLITI